MIEKKGRVGDQYKRRHSESPRDEGHPFSAP
jgi:hypothetical protein